MKVALYNLEPNIVNSAMMQVSAYHKSKGDQVYTYYPVLHDSYDRVYAFSIFTFTPKKYIKKDMVVGGTGFDPEIKLPSEIEDSDYDWSLYPNCDFSLIWFSRGCIRNCSFCIVRQKEGYIHSVESKNLNPNGKYIKVMDNNFFANPKWRSAIQQLQEWNQPVDFQGVDVRLLNQEQCEALNSLNIRYKKRLLRINIAWDFPEIDLLPTLKKVIQWIKPYKFHCYVLVGYNSSPEQDLYRIEELRKLHIDPFVMIYNKRTDDPFLTSFARWVNRKEFFRTCSWNEFYDSYKTYRFANPLQEVT